MADPTPKIESELPNATPALTSFIRFVTAAGASVKCLISTFIAQIIGTTSGTVAAGDDSRITGAAQKSANLSDLANAATARTNLGLGNVNNTADSAKPVSTAQQTALDAKAPLANPTFTGTVNGITKAMVGLGNVDNTADASKPVSTAQQTALDAKLSIIRTVTALAYNTSVSLDFTKPLQTIAAAAGDLTLTSSNLAAGAEIEVAIAKGAANYGFTAPAGWKFYCPRPTVIGAGSGGYLYFKLLSLGTTDAGVLVTEFRDF